LDELCHLTFIPFHPDAWQEAKGTNNMTELHEEKMLGKSKPDCCAPIFISQGIITFFFYKMNSPFNLSGFYHTKKLSGTLINRTLSVVVFFENTPWKGVSIT
jgi:hypothetical protein